MSSANSLIGRAITGMPSGPEEEDSLDVDRAARSSAVVMGLVTFEGSKSGETVMTSSSLIGDLGGGLLRTLALCCQSFSFTWSINLDLIQLEGVDLRPKNSFIDFHAAAVLHSKICDCMSWIIDIACVSATKACVRSSLSKAAKCCGLYLPNSRCAI